MEPLTSIQWLSLFSESPDVFSVSHADRQTQTDTFNETDSSASRGREDKLMRRAELKKDLEVSAGLKKNFDHR